VADVDLDVAEDVSLTRGPFDRVLQRPRTQDAEAGSQFVFPCEWTADDGARTGSEPEPHAL
jgi:hypothetical protein